MLLWQQNMHDSYDASYHEVRWDIARKAFFCALLVYGLLCLPFIIFKSDHELVVSNVVVRSDAVPVLFTGKQRKSTAQKSGTGTNMNNISAKKVSAYKEKKKVVEKKKITSQPKKHQKSKEKVTEKPKHEAKPLEKDITKTVQKKTELPKKVELKKNEPQQQREPKKSEPILKKELKKPEPEKVVNTVPETAAATIQKDEKNEIFIGSSDDNFEGDRYDVQTKAHMALSMALIRAWKPPRVKIQQPAIVVVELDAQGKPMSVELQQKSGALIHDIESRAAALRADYPQDSWGKKFTISFGD